MGRGLSTAPLPPGGRQRLALPCRRVSATSSLDLSPRVRDRCTDNSAMQRKLEELRRESHIILWVTRPTMRTVTLSLGSLSLSFGHVTRCLSQSCAGRSIGEGRALSATGSAARQAGPAGERGRVSSMAPSWDVQRGAGPSECQDRSPVCMTEDACHQRPAPQDPRDSST